MTENQLQLHQLLAKLEQLLQRQNSFAREIEALRQEIEALKKPTTTKISENQTSAAPVPPPKIISPVQSIPEQPLATTAPAKTPYDNKLESFIGENLISKIGIIVLVLGVAIGVKYVIDHNLISPLVRICLGYLVGFVLLVLTYRLKSHYLEYSVALLSGAVSILYFTTFAAHLFYQFYSFGLCFGLMLATTIFTVLAAMYFNRSFIALLGLIGAYVLPYLLYIDPKEINLLFPYLSLVNLGILLIALSRNWKFLNVVAFIWTWLIFFGWYITLYKPVSQFVSSWAYLCVFFCIFYGIFLAYKLNKLEPLKTGDVVLISSNALLFCFFGIRISVVQFDHHNFSGLIASLSAGIHFLMAYTVYRQTEVDLKITRFLSILGWSFLTIAVPLQFDGVWVMVFWGLEAGLMFVWGRLRSIPLAEISSYFVMGLAGIQLANSWVLYVYSYPINPVRFFNADFLSSIFFAGILAGVNYIHSRFLIRSPWIQHEGQNQLLRALLGTGFVLVLYFTLFCEISAYWIHAYGQFAEPGQSWSRFYFQEDIDSFRWIWLINYTLLFIGALTLLNWFWIKSKELGILSLGLQLAAVVVVFILGFYLLNGFYATYFTHPDYVLYDRIRYLTILFLLMMLGTGIPYLWQQELSKDLKITFELVLYSCVLFVVSNEIMLIGTSLAYKLGLSLWWGVFALGLIVLGIWKRKPHLRISGIFLFGATLLKLFFYDIEHLATIPKTVIFIALGMLLLLVSYLYNRYKEWLNPDQEPTNLSPDHQKSSHSNSE